MAVIIEEITATVIPPERPAESEREQAPEAAMDRNKLRALLELQAERERRLRVS